MNEAEAREHSFEWLREMLITIGRYESALSAKDMRLSFLATQAAQHGGEAFDMMDDILDKLDEQAKTPEEQEEEAIATNEDDQMRMQLMSRNPAAFQRVQVLDGGISNAS